jgi:mannose-6-phosphate isomerase-like protein (cupin superfamily)
MEKVSLAEAFADIDEPWTPRLAGELNGQHVKLARAEGSFTWHHHESADELFLVTAGRLRIEFRDRAGVTLEAGELAVVPRGVEHRPVAEPEAELLLFEPAGTRNTGDTDNEYTREELESV